MILVDYRKGSAEFAPLIQKYGVKTEVMSLEFADFAFEGNGPKGPMPIAVERKALHDMLNCIDDARYAAVQRPGMDMMYKGGICYLMVEGEWMCNRANGFLLEAHNGQWHYCKPAGKTVLYSKLYRYLISVGLAGVTVTHSRNPEDTAYNLCEMYHYYQKRWTDHTAMKEIHRLPIPTMVLDNNIPLVRKWAADIKGIGIKLSEIAARRFKTGIMLAEADEDDWVTIPDIGEEKAKQIVREVRGK